MKRKIAMRKDYGFTLVEMAIVLLIVGLLLGGMLLPLSAQVEQQRITETKKAQDEITQALLGYAVANGRLPCPALPTTATGSANAGAENYNAATGVCNNIRTIGGYQVAVGVVPWAALGVNETDAWGRRYTYAVTAEFARKGSGQTAFVGCTPPSNPSYSAFALCSQGRFSILSTATGGSTIASTIPAVVISHGKNGNYAYTSQGTQIAAGTADTDEQENRLTGGGTNTANLNFVSKTPTPTYDDLTVWVSPNTLMNRMVAAGKLP